MKLYMVKASSDSMGDWAFVVVASSPEEAVHVLVTCDDCTGHGQPFSELQLETPYLGDLGDLSQVRELDCEVSGPPRVIGDHCALV